MRGNCNSPKDVVDPFTKLHDETTADSPIAAGAAAAVVDESKLKQSGEDCTNDDGDDDDVEDNDEGNCSDNLINQQSTSLLKLYDSANQPFNTCDQTQMSARNVGDVKLRKPIWNYHNSDLGLNKLELNFLNDDCHDIFNSCDDHLPLAMAAASAIGTTQPLSNAADPTKAAAAGSSCHRKGTNSALKIASSSNLEINKWNSITQFNGGKPPESTASLNFINGNLSSDDEDNDDVFNSCELIHQNNKSKSVELNEFRMMFGSSPTLLNTNNYNSISQTSRLDAVPFQYRRGYSNLNDACLSSSTSDLECFQQSSKKKVFNKSKNELPSLYRHRNNEHLDYIRSYENLDRTRIVRMRNDRMNGVGIGGNSNSAGTSGKSSISSSLGGRESYNLSRDRCLHEEDDTYDNFSSYSNLCFENDAPSIGCIGTGNINRKLKKNEPVPGIGDLGFPSQESIFNINFDNFEDDVLEIDTRRLFENSIELETPPGMSQLNPCGLSTATDSKTNSLLLPDINSTSRTLSNTQAVIQQHIASNGRTRRIDDGVGMECKGGGGGGGGNTDGDDNCGNLLGNQSAEIGGKKSSKKKLRCAQCNKKLGVIMVMKCHCENVFCAQHRYAEAHNCTYNFKQEGKKILAKENPLVIAQKLPKI